MAEPPTPPSLAWVRDHVGQARVAGDTEALGPNLAGAHGLRDIRGHDLPTLRRYYATFYALGGTPAPIGEHRPWVVLSDPGARRVLDVFGARYVFTDRDGAPPAGLRVAFTGKRDRVLENPTAFPAARVVTRWRPAAGYDDALARAKFSSTQSLLEEPLIEGSTAPAGGPTDGRSGATVERLDDQNVRVRVRAARAGYLVLADTYYPGWEARVDGRAAPIRPANVAFRAVPVPAGNHTVTFTYSPASVRAGGAVTVGALLIVVVVLASGPVRRRRAREGGQRSTGAT